MRSVVLMFLLSGSLTPFVEADQPQVRRPANQLPATWLSSGAFDVNARGDVVGWFDNGSVPNSTRSGMFMLIVNNKRLRTFAIIPQDAGINSHGQVIGTYITGEERHHFLMSRSGHLLPLPTSANLVDGLSDVNARGTIVGYISDDTQVSGGTHGAVISRDQLRVIDNPFGYPVTLPLSIADNGMIVGIFGGTFDDPRRGFILDRGQWQALDYPGAWETVATAVASNGLVGGWAVLDDGLHGFVYRDGVFHDIGRNLAVRGVTTSGWVVGEALKEDGTATVFSQQVRFR
jgi:hypothetical protein